MYPHTLKRNGVRMFVTIMAVLLILPLVLQNKGEASEKDTAPGKPGNSSTWTTGSKTGLGTSFYEPSMGKSKSNVWYTLTNGVMSEVYYPDVTQANIKSLQLVVTDGKTFTDIEKQDTTHQMKLLYDNALVYKQINTDKDGKYKIEKTYITDPQNNTVLTKVTFRSLVGKVSDYKVFVYSNPSVNNSGKQDSGKTVKKNGSTYLTTNEKDTALALTASVPFSYASTGYTGRGGGLKDLQKDFDLDAIYKKASDGNVAQIAQVNLNREGAKRATFTLALGFGDSTEKAITAAQNSLRYPFARVEAHYRKGWKNYVKRLDKPKVGSKKQYYTAAMVLKAYEDKKNPGAIIASLSIPWGNDVNADQGGVGGYHLIWSRDLYEVASSLAAVGDKATAKRALAYLDDVQQKPDGSFPQNSWLDGRPYWGGLQLDEVAFPIILAGQLGVTGRYQSLVKPAADFIVENGPYTPQERWEEESGYSPSTIAAEIAGLTVAGKMARNKGDFESAAVYFATADKWAEKVEDWTVTTTGDLSDKPYYIRISDTKNPDDGSLLEINNGGGTYPEKNIVDAGFLELVRLGIKPADDPLITRSLNVIDQTIKYQASYGPVWYRYNHDGYGEKKNGVPYDGTGIGRAWPLLTGERGEYEIAFASTDKSSRPDNLFGARKLLQTMAGAANDGYMIAEQVWDQPPIPGRDLYPGQGSGSATPLAWSMAQYLRLEASIEQGKVVERPTVVEERYITEPPEEGPTVSLVTPENGTVVSQSKVAVKGQTKPNTTVVLSTGDGRVSTTSDDNGAFSETIQLQSLGKNTITIVSYDNKRSVSSTQLTLIYQLPAILKVLDPVGDDYGTGSYTYPTNPVFKQGDFDLRSFRVSADQENAYFTIGLGNLDNPWGGPSGFSKQLIDIYIDKDEIKGSGQRWTKGLQAQLDLGAAWEKMIRVTGNWNGDTHVYNSDWSNAGSVQVKANYAEKTVRVTVPVDELGGTPKAGWGLTVVIGGENNGGVRQVVASKQQWYFGGGTDGTADPNIIDMIVPSGESQKAILDWKEGSPVTLPVIRIK